MKEYYHESSSSRRLCLLYNQSMIGIIYQYKNKINGKRYVGRTVQTLEARKREGYFSTKFANALEKYGWDNFETEILWELEADNKVDLITNLNIIEEIIIMNENLQDDEFGYNVKAGGFNGTFKHTPEAIEKIRIAGRKPNKGQFRKGSTSWVKGKTWKNTNDYKERHSIIMKESYKKNNRKSALFGKHWYTNGIKNIVATNCPDGFIPGKVHKK